MSKMFTAVAIGQLAERRKLSLEDEVAKHLGSDWLDPGVARRIRVRHLLSHTSGLGDYLDDERYMEASRGGDASLARYRPLLASEKVAFEPGTEWAYSNLGFLVLGAIIEVLSGQTYEDYLDLHLFQPAGMTDSGCSPADLPVPRLATGYTRGEPRGGIAYRSNTLRLDRGGPAGACYSTVGDLLRFERALRSGRLLGKPMLQRLWTVTPESRSVLPYGMGFSVVELPGETVVGHSGGFPGVSASFRMHLETGVTSIVLANYDGAAQAVDARLTGLLARLEEEERPEMRRIAIKERPAPPPDGCAGLERDDPEPAHPSKRSFKMRIPKAILAAVFTLTAALARAEAQRGVFVEDMDRKANPCSDFYDYANGAWRSANPIPATMNRWSRRWAAGEAAKEQLKTAPGRSVGRNGLEERERGAAALRTFTPRAWTSPASITPEFRPSSPCWRRSIP